MSDLSKKIEEKLNNLFDNVGNTDHVKALKAYDDTILYLEGLAANADPVFKSSLGHTLLSIELAKQITNVAKQHDEEIDKLKADLNNALGRIKRLEEAKGFDNAEKMR